jgi:hypothetical protein
VGLTTTTSGAGLAKLDMPGIPTGSCFFRGLAMRPVRIIAALLFAATAGIPGLVGLAVGALAALGVWLLYRHRHPTG